MMIKLCKLALIFAFWSALLCHADKVSGRVYEMGNCDGVANAVVRFTPPKESSNPIVVTATDKSGAFAADLPSNSEYYLTVSFGAQQLYGRVVTITSEPLSIPLHTNSKSEQNCKSSMNSAATNTKTAVYDKISAPVKLLLHKPMAITAQGHGDLELLDGGPLDTGDIFLLTQESSQLAVRRRISLPAWFAPIDLISGKLNDQGYLFVLGVNGQVGLIQQLSANDGQVKKTWTLFKKCTGLALDETRGILYVVEQPNRIVALDLQTGKTRSLLDINVNTTSAAGEGVLGPMAFDVQKSKLYVADVLYGELYEIDVMTRKYHRIADHLGQPTGLIFSKKTAALYIADGSRTVISLKPRLDSKVSIFSKQKAFRALSGITLDEDDTLWLSDRETHTLFHLSSDGKIIQQWP